MHIRRHYWRPHPVLPANLVEALVTSLAPALQSADPKIDTAFLHSLVAQGFDAKPRSKVLGSRKFEDDIRVCHGNHVISIEIENYGNRLEFDILKMMTFAEEVPQIQVPWGCLIIPANKELENPYISGNGRERIWDYLTRRLMPMTVPITGLRLANILVLGFERLVKPIKAGLEVAPGETIVESNLKGFVQQAWVKAGRPSWDLENTVKEAIYADLCIERDEKRNPAPMFRENRIKKNSDYLRTWVLGCKFPWLTRR